MTLTYEQLRALAMALTLTLPWLAQWRAEKRWLLPAWIVMSAGLTLTCVRGPGSASQQGRWRRWLGSDGAGSWSRWRSC